MKEKNERPAQGKRVKLKNRLPEMDRGFLMLTLLILLLGMIILTSASSVVAWQRFADPYFYVKHQLEFGVALGLVAMFIFARIDYHKWRSYAVPAMILTIGLLIVVLIPGVGFSYGGSNSWINFGIFFFQPAELAKLTFIIYLASWLTNQDRYKQVSELEAGFIPFMVLLGIISFLMLLQPDFGTLSVIAVIALSMYFVAGGRIKHLAGVTLGAVVLFFLLIRTSAARFSRFTVFLNPDLDPQGIGYHINQAKLAIGSGGIFGLGLGHSRQKFNYLPEVIGDSIFAVLAEEAGFILTTALILLLLLFILRGLKIARHAPDLFGRLLVVGIMMWVTFQTFVNIGAMVGLLPLTGLPLPLISYGSSSVLTLLAGLGIVLNISRNQNVGGAHFTSVHNERSWKR